MSALTWQLNPFSVIALSILLIDQALDFLIEQVLPIGASHTIIPRWIGLMRHTDPYRSLLDSNGFFLLLAIILMPFLWWYKERIRPDTLYQLAVSVLLGGLLGNLADGLRIGYPVDYFVLVIPFNLADLALILGGGLLIYRMLKGEAKRNR